ncbi:hypothetical protein L2E82_33083 [Cichorium intybus]|uniref:Uncharacterized protein n=1 Tax=Cichorium intybus TaxID=13427 RepID=A0ACB9BJ79_CICIN|nr:hypothetical protein L2E82_33083 [Cichorium intybus]
MRKQELTEMPFELGWIKVVWHKGKVGMKKEKMANDSSRKKVETEKGKNRRQAYNWSSTVLLQMPLGCKAGLAFKLDVSSLQFIAIKLKGYLKQPAFKFTNHYGLSPTSFGSFSCHWNQKAVHCLCVAGYLLGNWSLTYQALLIVFYCTNPETHPETKERKSICRSVFLAMAMCMLGNNDRSNSGHGCRHELLANSTNSNSNNPEHVEPNEEELTNVGFMIWRLPSGGFVVGRFSSGRRANCEGVCV